MFSCAIDYVDLELLVLWVVIVVRPASFELNGDSMSETKSYFRDVASQ